MSEEDIKALLAERDRAFRRRDAAELLYYVALERYQFARQKLKELLGPTLGLSNEDILGVRVEPAAQGHERLGRLSQALVRAHGRWEAEQDNVRQASQAVRKHLKTQDGT